MAAIHQVISLGIGTPADIPHFILVGLSPAGPVGPFTPAWAANSNTYVGPIAAQPVTT